MLVCEEQEISHTISYDSPTSVSRFQVLRVVVVDFVVSSTHGNPVLCVGKYVEGFVADCNVVSRDNDILVGYSGFLDLRVHISPGDINVEEVCVKF